jgi:hypothetical protein
MPLPDAAEPGLHDDMFHLRIVPDGRPGSELSSQSGGGLKLTCSRHHSWFQTLPPLVAAPAWDADGAAPSQDDGTAPSYEDLCRAHVEAIISAAAAADVQTALAARWAALLDSSWTVCHTLHSRRGMTWWQATYGVQVPDEMQMLSQLWSCLQGVHLAAARAAGHRCAGCAGDLRHAHLRPAHPPAPVGAQPCRLRR